MLSNITLQISINNQAKKTKIVLVIKKTLFKFETEGCEFSKFWGSLDQFIRKMKGQK